VQEGITINGLSLELREDKKKDWRNEPTASYYAAHVIGGAGAFLVSAYGMGDFEEALKRKLVLEMLAGSDQSLPVRPSTLAGEQTSASGRHPSRQMLKQVAASGTSRKCGLVTRTTGRLPIADFIGPIGDLGL
jgi:hypothetical protein